jgi:hypothetical protein
MLMIEGPTVRFGRIAMGMDASAKRKSSFIRLPLGV